MYSEEERAWILAAWRSSAKMKVLGALVALSIRFAAARGELAVLVRARKGCEGFGVSRCGYILGCDVYCVFYESKAGDGRNN